MGTLLNDARGGIPWPDSGNIQWGSQASSEATAPSNGFGSGVYIQGAGVLASALGSVVSAINAKNNLKFQSGMSALNAQQAQFTADMNKQIAELGAQSALQQGQAQIASQTAKAGQVMGAQKASMTANGIDLGEGSAAEVQASTALMKEQDTNTLQANAIRAAWGYRLQGDAQYAAQSQQAQNFKTQADFASSNASQINPAMSGLTTLIGGAGSVAKSWYSFNGTV